MRCGRQRRWPKSLSPGLATLAGGTLSSTLRTLTPGTVACVCPAPHSPSRRGIRSSASKYRSEEHGLEMPPRQLTHGHASSPFSME